MTTAQAAVPADAGRALLVALPERRQPNAKPSRHDGPSAGRKRQCWNHRHGFQGSSLSRQTPRLPVGGFHAGLNPASFSSSWKNSAPESCGRRTTVVDSGDGYLGGSCSSYREPSPPPPVLVLRLDLSLHRLQLCVTARGSAPEQSQLLLRYSTMSDRPPGPSQGHRGGRKIHAGGRLPLP